MRQTHKNRFGFGSALLVTALALSFNTSAAPRPKLDLSVPVFVGDSLLAGFQNSSLMASQQSNGIAAIIARQSRADIKLPLIAEPGIPNVLTLTDPGPPPLVERSTGTSTGRLDMTTQTLDLAVPGHNVRDALETRPNFPIDSLTDMVLGFPGLLGGVSRSQVEWAENLAPTTIIVWLGNNDVLGAAIAGDASLATPAAQFEDAYTNVINRLAATGAKLVVANIPDVTVIPYVTPLAEAAALFQIPLAQLAAALGIPADSFVTLDGVPAIIATLQGEAPPPLAANYTLDAAEIVTLKNVTQQYNEIISRSAQQNNAILVDTYAFLNQLDRRGAVVNGRKLSTRFLGGIFSLDGVHPSNTGNALTANYFIKTMNRRGAAGLPPVSVLQVSRRDPLLPPRRGRP